MVGLSLVCMEVVSDFGTVEYFSLQTLTLGIFNVWIGMNDIAAAAQISIFTFFFSSFYSCILKPNQEAREVSLPCGP